MKNRYTIESWKIIKMNSRFAQSLMTAMTFSVDTSCALPNRRLANLCKSDFSALLAKCSSFRLITVVWDTCGRESNLTFNSCTSLGILFFVATLIAVEISVRFSHALPRVSKKMWASKRSHSWTEFWLVGLTRKSFWSSSATMFF